MKKAILICCLLGALQSEAQQDTTKVEQYCQMVAKGRFLSNKVTIDMDYGEVRSIWKGNRVKDENGNVKKFNTVIDGLNYLGKNNWKLVNAFPVPTDKGESVEYHYVFKKEFLKSETGE
ncbi:MAG: hypothetical protein ABIS12_17785 [Bacteroidia bacterium]